RKASVWDTFSLIPGRIAHEDRADSACEHYTRFREDVTLMKELGLRAYRFSIAWPRVIPEGIGPINSKGLDFYNRLADELLAQDIEPYVTLFHWDLPQALEDKIGGWRSRAIADHFADYATVVGKALGDRVKHFFTINEFQCFTDLGYGEGVFAPGLTCDRQTVNQARHNAMLAHGKAVQALRNVCPKDCRIGLAENVMTTVPAFESEENIAAAKSAFLEEYSFFLRTIMEGHYQDKYLADLDAPVLEERDLAIIGSPLDFVGLNSYSPVRILADESEQGWTSLPDRDGKAAGNSPDHESGPEVIYWGTRWLNEIWKVKEVVISENGCPDQLEPDETGEIDDTRRTNYLRQHLISAHRAVAEGYPLRGYFAWSLMDNFEWIHGYQKRFGLYHVDFNSQKRTPKLSAKFYREVIRQNRVV
ncbi:MAG: family 1 glycosylhydrolase, partial [Verrucomicrobiae bacterium]|nr:family 1 glycosylhydrolase [Verrucomicrobiae bacterium]